MLELIIIIMKARHIEGIECEESAVPRLLSESNSGSKCAQRYTVRQHNGLKECALAILFYCRIVASWLIWDTHTETDYQGNLWAS